MLSLRSQVAIAPSLVATTTSVDHKDFDTEKRTSGSSTGELGSGRKTATDRACSGYSARRPRIRRVPGSARLPLEPLRRRAIRCSREKNNHAASISLRERVHKTRPACCQRFPSGRADRLAECGGLGRSPHRGDLRHLRARHSLTQGFTGRHSAKNFSGSADHRKIIFRRAAASGELIMRSAQSGRCLFHDRRQFGYLIFRRFARLLCACYSIRSLHFSPGWHWRFQIHYLLL